MTDDSRTDNTLSIETEQVGDALVVHLSGDIDELGADALSSALDGILEGGGCRIIFDMSDVMFMGSTGLGQIMRTYRAVKACDGYVRIANPQPLIADLFKLTKLDKLLEIHPSVEQASRDAQ